VPYDCFSRPSQPVFRPDGSHPFARSKFTMRGFGARFGERGFFFRRQKHPRLIVASQFQYDAGVSSCTSGGSARAVSTAPSNNFVMSSPSIKGAAVRLRTSSILHADYTKRRTF
jgi:hypothetical protein